jgi:DNA primase
MAAGIPPETIENIRAQADIVQVISEYLTLKKAGANYRALCPFHREKTPSFMVSPSKQIYHCFGCGAGGNVFGFLMRQEGLTFPEAVRFLAERLGVQIKQQDYAPEQRELREQLFSLYEFATRFFQKCLVKSDDARVGRDYLKKRNLDDAAIKKFSLGFAPTAWDLFTTTASKKGFTKEALLKGGLAKKSSDGRIYDTFRNRIIFPICGVSGKVIAFGGRALGEDQPKYINSPETVIYQKGQVLYNLHRAKKSIANTNTVIVVEGYTDVIRLVLSGIDNVVASSGTAFTPAQARVIKRYASEVVLVLDSDAAGEAAKLLANGVLFAEDLGVRLVLLSGKDPDEFIQSEGVEEFERVIGQAQNFLDYYGEKTLAGWKNSRTEEKIEKAKTLVSLVSRIPDPIRKSEYLRMVAGRLDIDPESLLKASQKESLSDKIVEGEAQHFERKLQHEEREYMWLVKLLVKKPQYIARVREHMELDSLGNSGLQHIFETIFDLGEADFKESALLDRIQTAEAQQILSHLMFEERGPELLYPIEWWTGFISTRQKERKLSELATEIAATERDGDIRLLEQLLKQKAEIGRELVAIKEEMMRVSVHSSVGSIAGG